MDIGFIKNVGRFVTANSNPDLTIFLDLALERGLKHRALSQDRIEQRALFYHKRVRRGYLRLAGQEPKRIKIVKVEQNKNQTQLKIRKIVEHYVI